MIKATVVKIYDARSVIVEFDKTGKCSSATIPHGQTFKVGDLVELNWNKDRKRYDAIRCDTTVEELRKELVVAKAEIERLEGEVKSLVETIEPGSWR